MLEAVVIIVVGAAFQYLINKLDTIEKEVAELIERTIRIEEKMKEDNSGGLG